MKNYKTSNVSYWMPKNFNDIVVVGNTKVKRKYIVPRKKKNKHMLRLLYKTP